ncbi:GNAT family N-acetyltransferase [Tessaracoccus coleopterorum]|uniref:GNAT family N-acetyltransferase n=1 Tax=Tessaracoccus coleopterorum TaxID=2714950 RepID=UPI002F9191F1
MNEGRGPHPAVIINTVGVLPSHRRRGLLKEMMRRQLDLAAERGESIAVLTASEATIYGRFGFAPASRAQEFEIDTGRFAFRDGVEVAEGPVEFVHPSFLAAHWARVTTAHQARHRGAIGHLEAHRLVDTGAWDPAAAGPSKDLRAVAHFDTDGVVDGFALFKFKGWDEAPRAEVQKMCAPDVTVERALWRALAGMDLIRTLTHEGSTGDPLPLSLADARAVKVKGVGDWVWLRLLNLPTAVAGRAFDADGRLVIRVDDAMGYADGTWLLSVTDGVGICERSDAEPAVRLDVDTLALLWHGDRGAQEVARAGLVSGSADGIRTLGRLLRWDEPAANLSWF